MLSVIILSAFTVLGLIVLPALAEIRSRRSDEEPPDSDDEDRGDVLLAPGSERKGFGVLLARRRESSGDGESRASADAWYVQFGPGEQDVERWEGGAFVAVLSDDRSSQ